MSPVQRFPGFIPPTLAVAEVTAREIVRDRVFYNILLFVLILFGVTYAASEMTFISPSRIILDLGYSAVNIACSMVAIFNGAAMLGKEIERRTMYVALARPISRFQFVLGKYFGLLFILLMNWALLVTLEASLFSLTGGTLVAVHATGFLLLWVQSAVLAGLALFFSSFMTTSLSVIVTIGTYLVGNSISDIQRLIERLPPGGFKSVLHAVSLLIPNLEHFNLGFRITYALPVPSTFVWNSLAYGFLLSFLTIYGAAQLLHRREAQS